MTKWEYLTVEEKTLALLPSDLKKYGDGGWELVSIVSLPDKWWVIYKRPKQE